MMQNDHILTLSCPDTIGIVFHVTGFLFERGCNILDSQQFGDETTGRFFMRVHFDVPADQTIQAIRSQFDPIAQKFSMDWGMWAVAAKPKLVLMVSKFGHCLNDLLFRFKSGQLQIEIPAIISNHTDFALLAASYGIPFYHLPVTPSSKTQQERQVLQIIQQTQADLVVLARYMQILSSDLCLALNGRAINIHHSFLPGFKGAKPYAQAHERGVKLIGATAHYVTSDLDEGPIIEQDVARVDHSMDPSALAALGRDIECMTLARAVRWHCEHRVLLNGQKTVVFN